MIRLGILGTGRMADDQAGSFKEIRGVKLVACCDLNIKNANSFAEKHNIPMMYDSLDEMLKNEKLDAITNVTFDAAHYSTSLKIIEHGGIHLLCEKPLATNAEEALEMTKKAEDAGIINMINLSYRNSSALQKATELIDKGKIGKVMHVEASYLQSWLSSKGWGDWRIADNWLWRLSSKCGSKGVLGDIGVHILDFASFPAGEIKSVSCKLKTFHKAKNNKIGKYNLDANDSAIMIVEFTDGALGIIHTTRWATGQMNSLSLKIHGDKGGIRINLDESYNILHICSGKNIDKAIWKEIRCKDTLNIYKRFIKSIKEGKNDQPDFRRGALIQKILDASFESDKTGRTINV